MRRSSCRIDQLYCPAHTTAMTGSLGPSAVGLLTPGGRGVQTISAALAAVAPCSHGLGRRIERLERVNSPLPRLGATSSLAPAGEPGRGLVSESAFVETLDHMEGGSAQGMRTFVWSTREEVANSDAERLSQSE